MTEHRWRRLSRTAEYLDLPERFLRRFVAEHRLPYYRAGRYILFDLNDVDEWLGAPSYDNAHALSQLAPLADPFDGQGIAVLEALKRIED